MKLGLVSVSFRQHTPEEIVKEALAADLTWIEWGSDVHAPCDDTDKLDEIVALQEKTGIRCSSYGTYFRLGINPMEELPAYIRAAKRLGTHVIRLWCGNKSPQKYTPEEKSELFQAACAAAELGRQEGVIFCMECHNNTYTQEKETALELMQFVNSPHFRMYWQPNQKRTIAENMEYARLLGDYIIHIHVFQWKEKLRFSLAEGIDEWKTYLGEIPGEHALLLEFMPDDSIYTLAREAKLLHQIGEERI